MVCGNKLYAGGLLLSICDGALCQYQYQELGELRFHCNLIFCLKLDVSGSHLSLSYDCNIVYTSLPLLFYPNHICSLSGLMQGLTTPRVSAPVLALLMMAFHAAVSSDRRQDILVICFYVSIFCPCNMSMIGRGYSTRIGCPLFLDLSIDQ